MKILNIGSLNLDKVFGVKQIVSRKETILADRFEILCGGKGLNQSVALARAGASVCHAGAVGFDGEGLRELLKKEGVDVARIRHIKAPNGQAIIQVDEKGQNAIIVFGGTNQMLEDKDIDQAFEGMEAGDYLLLQNEISPEQTGRAIRKAHEMRMKVAFNLSPVTDACAGYPLELVDYFIINEVEGRYLSGCETGNPEEMLDILTARYPSAAVVLTVGEQGVYYCHGEKRIHCPGYPARVVDTTAAGDTFCGYFLAGIMKGDSEERALIRANMAGALAVEKSGAAVSIPTIAEVIEECIRRG